MSHVSQVSHRGRKVSRPDEDAVDAGNARDCTKVIDSALSLNLHQQAHLVACSFQVVRYPIPARRASQDCTDAAHSPRRILHSGYKARSLLSGLDHWNEQSLSAYLEYLLYEMSIANSRAHYRMSLIRSDRLKLCKETAKIVRAMFSV